MYLDDNHTSAVGMREVIKAKGVTDIRCVTEKCVQECLAGNDGCVKRNDECFKRNDVHHSRKFETKQKDTTSSQSPGANLFLYPAQSNFSGYKYPLEWIKQIQQNGLSTIDPKSIINNSNESDQELINNASSNMPQKDLDEENCNASNTGNTHVNGNHVYGCHRKGSYGDWFVFLDAAAFVSTSPLDLSLHQPDFVAVSFYKIFGYPTGLGM